MQGKASTNSSVNRESPAKDEEEDYRTKNKNGIRLSSYSLGHLLAYSRVHTNLLHLNSLTLGMLESKVHPIKMVTTIRFGDISTGYRKGYTTRQNRSPVIVQTFTTEAQRKKSQKTLKMGEHWSPKWQIKEPGIVVTAVNKSEKERDKMKLLQVVCSLRRVVIKKMTKVLPRIATTPIVAMMIQNQISGGTS
ncbi:hypothetical protein ACROYT_G006779 [Oculina patagonica]